jgi:hypothetical protein
MSAIAFFSEVCNFKFAAWELNFRNFRHIFYSGIRSGSWKKIGGKKSRATVPWRQVLASRETDSSKNIFGWFLKPSWAEEKGLESSGTGRRLRKVAELRKSNFEAPQLQFRNFFSPQLRNRFGCPLYCGVADLNCGCSPLL